MNVTQKPQPIICPSNASGDTEDLPTTTILNLQIANATVGQTLAWLQRRMASRLPTRVSFFNAHCGNVAARDPAYRKALSSSDAILPDGSGVAAAARLKGVRLAANLNGTDLVPLLCERMAQVGQSVFLLGGRPGVAEEAAEALRTANPGLVIAGTQHGFFGPEAERGIIRRINESGADLLLVAVGVPQQEMWLERVAARLAPPVTMGVGALFDFLSKRVPRAPSVLRHAGLEWIYRLYQEPGRMWRRYLIGNFTFMARAARDAGTLNAARLVHAPRLTAKRALDVGAAFMILLLGVPVWLAIAGAIAVTTPGPVIFRQTRIGKDGLPFTLFKFRSMYIDADARREKLMERNFHGQAGVTFKLKRDPRVTPLGWLLRKSSVDEVPQLWNVLRGDMSLVGPRPPLPSEVERYTLAERRRLAGLPGLTCLWQVSGRADLSFDRQVELDVEYLAKRSLVMDLQILLRTVPAVLTARGAY